MRAATAPGVGGSRRPRLRRRLPRHARERALRLPQQPHARGFDAVIALALTAALWRGLSESRRDQASALEAVERRVQRTGRGPTTCLSFKHPLDLEAIHLVLCVRQREQQQLLELTEEQRQVVASEENPTILDPQTQEAYILVRKAVFDRIKGLLYDDTELTHDELRLLLAGSAKENGWDEPGMEQYDRYNER